MKARTLKKHRISFSPAGAVWGKMGQAWIPDSRNSRSYSRPTQILTPSDFFCQFFGYTDNPVLAPIAQVFGSADRALVARDGTTTTVSAALADKAVVGLYFGPLVPPEPRRLRQEPRRGSSPGRLVPGPVQRQCGALQRSTRCSVALPSQFASACVCHPATPRESKATCSIALPSTTESMARPHLKLARLAAWAGCADVANNSAVQTLCNGTWTLDMIKTRATPCVIQSVINSRMSV